MQWYQLTNLWQEINIEIFCPTPNHKIIVSFELWDPEHFMRISLLSKWHTKHFQRLSISVTFEL